MKRHEGRRHMRTAIHVLAIINVALVVSAVVWLIGLAIGLDNALNLCTQEDPVRMAACTNAVGARYALPVVISLLALVIGGIIGLVVWVLALAKTANVGAWGWFVSVLLLPAF